MGGERDLRTEGGRISPFILLEGWKDEKTKGGFRMRTEEGEVVMVGVA